MNSTTMINATIRTLTNWLCQIDDEQLSKIPKHGPLIIVANHINFLEIPLLYTRLNSNMLTGFVKHETWENPILGLLFNHWNGIPIRRNEPDITAFRLGLEALKNGKIVAVAPEGTRSGDGKLQRAYSGVVTLALHSEAPILPLAYYGSENFWFNLKRFKRTDFHVLVGKPFLIHTNGAKVTRTLRDYITQEIMYQVASLLPPAYRGYYADLSKATSHYLAFLS